MSETLQQRARAAAANKSLAIGEAWNLLDELADRLDTLEAALAEAREDLKITHAIGETFWVALKRLNLVDINVANPGQHVSDLIDRLEQVEAERDTAWIEIDRRVEFATTLEKEIRELAHERDLQHQHAERAEAALHLALEAVDAACDYFGNAGDAERVALYGEQAARARALAGGPR